MKNLTRAEGARFFWGLKRPKFKFFCAACASSIFGSQISGNMAGFFWRQDFEPSRDQTSSESPENWLKSHVFSYSSKIALILRSEMGPDVDLSPSYRICLFLAQNECSLRGISKKMLFRCRFARTSEISENPKIGPGFGKKHRFLYSSKTALILMLIIGSRP